MRITGKNGKSFRKKLHNGLYLLLVPEDHIQQQILWYGFYEKKYVLTWEAMIGNDSNIIDMGANIGYYTIVAAGRAKTGMVYAFEPAGGNFTSLDENVKLNDLQNVQTIRCAIGLRSEQKNFFISDRKNTGMSGLVPPENYSDIIESVHVITLDEWVISAGVEKIDFIKMDIEGSEFDALNGMSRILKLYKPVLFVEVSNELLNKYGSNAARLFELIRSYGYQSLQVVREKTLKVVNQPFEDELVVFLHPETLPAEGIVIEE